MPESRLLILKNNDSCEKNKPLDLRKSYGIDSVPLNCVAIQVWESTFMISGDWEHEAFPRHAHCGCTIRIAQNS